MVRWFVPDVGSGRVGFYCCALVVCFLFVFFVVVLFGLIVNCVDCVYESCLAFVVDAVLW